MRHPSRLRKAQKALASPIAVKPDPVVKAVTQALCDEEIADGRALGWIALAKQASRPNDTPFEHLCRTTYLMLVRHAFVWRDDKVQDVMSAASAACETEWPTSYDVQKCFEVLCESWRTLRGLRKNRRDFGDEIHLIKSHRGGSSKHRRLAMLRHNATRSQADALQRSQGASIPPETRQPVERRLADASRRASGLPGALVGRRPEGVRGRPAGMPWVRSYVRRDSLRTRRPTRQRSVITSPTASTATKTIQPTVHELTACPCPLRGLARRRRFATSPTNA